MQIYGFLIFWINLLTILSFIVMDLLGSPIPFFYIMFFVIFFSLSLLYTLLKHNLFLFFMSRTLSSVITILIITTLTFFLMRTIPGGPFDEEKALPAHVKHNIEKKYHLDQPIYQQYFIYMKDFLHGHLGYSYKYEGQEVKEIIQESLPISFKLGVYALLFAFSFGVPLGLLAAARHGTSFDSAAMMLAISGVSLPNFLLAPVLISLFSFGWPLNSFFPEFYNLLVEKNLLLPVALWQSPKHYILPIVTLGVRPAAIIARLTRASMLDVMSSDFVRTARSKGLQNHVILTQHILGNSLIPVLSYVGPLVAGVLSGSFVVETIFAIPGIAKYFIQGVFNRDYPLIMGLTLLFSILLILANLAVDILYKIIDPRVEVV